MNEMTIRLDRNGAAAVPGGQLLLGYAGNRGNYRLRIEQRGEWKGLTVCAHWHTPGASAATLVENGILTVPAAVTAVPGAGCLTFEGTDGSRTVTSADVRCKVCANSGTAEGTMPAPATPAWEALVGLLGTGGGITAAENRRCWPYCARWRRAMTQLWMPATVWRRCGATRSRRRRTFLPCWGRRSLEK